MDNLLCPVQEKLEEWKKVAAQLEKEHAKGKLHMAGCISLKQMNTCVKFPTVEQSIPLQLRHELKAVQYKIQIV